MFGKRKAEQKKEAERLQKDNDLAVIKCYREWSACNSEENNLVQLLERSLETHRDQLETCTSEHLDGLQATTRYIRNMLDIIVNGEAKAREIEKKYENN